jgi:hypothetical protein
MAFATSPTTLANLSHLTPRPIKGLFGDNYLSVGEMDFTQQFLPEVYEKEVELDFYVWLGQKCLWLLIK